MPLKIGKNRFIKIIDRTIPEILNLSKKASRLDLIDFCWMLKNLGADLIEINSIVLEKIGKLPGGIDFIYRIQSEKDVGVCILNNFRNCIIYEGMLLKMELVEKLAVNNVNIIAECKIHKLSEIYNLKRLKKINGINMIKEVWLSGLSNFTSLSWIRAAEKISGVLKANIGICPDNSSYNAVAVVADALINGINSAAVSFMGVGKESGYAAFEEILAIIKVLIYPGLKVDLSVLPEYSKHFSRMTGFSIPDNKPVIGSSLFVYESGIHADGIDKNPMTYEPFDPGMVGQIRKLSIGKHSGKKSIIKKLKELDMNVDIARNHDILRLIREKSIDLKRDLSDNEIKELCYR